MADVLDHEWFCSRVATEIASMAAVVSAAPDMSMDVATCPEWTVADLTRHTGTLHRWATSIVASGALSRPPLPEEKAPWPFADDWAQWLAAGTTPLVATLRSAGPGLPVWTWGPGGTSGWWARRMVHETIVHRADAELSLGLSPVIDPVAATDGIEEFLDNLPMARRARYRLAELPAGESLHLHATDADGEWLIRFTGTPGAVPSGDALPGAVPPDATAPVAAGFSWSRGHQKASVAVRGPVAELLLLVYGRIEPADPRLAVFGDATLLDTWLRKTAL